VRLAKRNKSSGGGESHPPAALIEPDVRLSPHPLLLSNRTFVRLCLGHRLLPSLVDRHLWLESRAVVARNASAARLGANRYDGPLKRTANCVPILR
jgi:hypothetical protein